MKNENIAVGLDIGTTKIVAMIGRKNEYGKLEILGIGKAKSSGIIRGVVSNIIRTIEAIQSAVKDAETNSGYKINDVVVGIAGQHIRSIQHNDYISRSNPEEVIKEEDIERLINQVYTLPMQPGEEIIHVLPQEYKISGYEITDEPIGMYGNRLESNFHVVVGQASSIRNVMRCVKDAGLNFSGLTLEPLASSDAVLSKEEKEAGVALIDIGGGTTDLAIFKDDIIRHTAVIPFGGNVITEDIKSGLSIIEVYAEQLKIKYGSAWPTEIKDNEIISIPGLRGRDPREVSRKELSRVIHARVIEIIEMIFSEIKAYGHEEPKKKLIAGIVLTGGGAELKHIKQVVEYITGMDTRIGFPNEHLAGNSSQELSSPIYATAVGLVMNSIKNNTQSAWSIAENQKANAEQEELQNNATTDTENQDSQQQFTPEEKTISKERKVRKNFFDRYIERIKDFLENAE